MIIILVFILPCLPAYEHFLLSNILKWLFFLIGEHCNHYEKIFFIIMVRVFTNGPGNQVSIPGRVIPKTQKMVLDVALLHTQHYKVWIKGSSALPYTRSPWLWPANLTNLIYMSIYKGIIYTYTQIYICIHIYIIIIIIMIINKYILYIYLIHGKYCSAT